jgi:hypothetical protein
MLYHDLLRPRLGSVEKPEVAANFELPLFNPELCLVDLSVVWVQDRAALPVAAIGAQILDEDQPDDGLVLVAARALDAVLRLALRVDWLGQAF